MIPAAFVALESLPLNRNGKLDRAALPVPGDAGDGGRVHVPPRTGTEQALAGIWAQVLGLDQVGIHDNFFELGGDSLHSLGVAARAKAMFDVALTPQDVMVRRSIAALAELIEERVLQDELLVLGNGEDDGF
jgi:acyl carrier protein